MNPKISAGLMMFRFRCGSMEVLLCHPGGPFFTHKDTGVWGIPKGEVEAGEALLEAAQREFQEETGLDIDIDEFLPLGSIVNRSGKRVHAWAFAGDCDTNRPVRSNLFQMEWPPRSGCLQSFPEVDRLQFFTVQDAKPYIAPSQIPLLDRLVCLLSDVSGESAFYSVEQKLNHPAR